MQVDEIKDATRNYLKEHVLNLADGGALNDDTPLISSGLVDSITTLHMVEFLEQKFNIEFQPHEVDKEHLDTIDKIGDFVLSKIAG
jgi:acyl carrier protein